MAGKFLTGVKRMFTTPRMHNDHRMFSSQWIPLNQPIVGFSLFIALLLINVIVVMFLMASTKWIAKLVHVPNKFLGGVILVLSFVGVFSIRNSFADCLFAAAFGFLGLIFRRLDWPLVPLVLGLATVACSAVPSSWLVLCGRSTPQQPVQLSRMVLVRALATA